jgi:hypothetical protein
LANFCFVRAVTEGIAYPSQADYCALVEAGRGALKNARMLLQAVGPIKVTLLPIHPSSKHSQGRGLDAGRGGRGRSNSEDHKGRQRDVAVAGASMRPGKRKLDEKNDVKNRGKVRLKTFV